MNYAIGGENRILPNGIFKCTLTTHVAAPCRLPKFLGFIEYGTTSQQNSFCGFIYLLV